MRLKVLPLGTAVREMGGSPKLSKMSGYTSRRALSDCDGEPFRVEDAKKMAQTPKIHTYYVRPCRGQRCFVELNQFYLVNELSIIQDQTGLICK